MLDTVLRLFVGCFTSVRLGYCFTPYQRLWLYNGAPLIAFYDTLGIRRTYSRLKPRCPHGVCFTSESTTFLSHK